MYNIPELLTLVLTTMVKIISKSDFFCVSLGRALSIDTARTSCLWHRDSVEQVISEVAVGGVPGDRGSGAVHLDAGGRGMHCL